MTDYQKALNLIRQYDTIVLHRHDSPDGDALGAQIGLKHILADNFPEKKVFMTGDAAGRYAFMDGAVMDEVPDEVFPQALSIILDCGDAELVSDERYTKAAASLRFDHHLYKGDFTDLDIVASDFESCCGLLTGFALSEGLRILQPAALALYTGMVTDSGRFRYDSTTPRTLRLAAELLERGIDTNALYLQLYAADIEEVKRRAAFIQKIRFTEGGVAYLYNTKEEVAALGVSTFDVSRGMIGIMADLKGVDIWANFTEEGEVIYAELRSSLYNINPVAVKYGGGGHMKASGATLRSRDEVTAMLKDLDEIRRSSHV